MVSRRDAMISNGEYGYFKTTDAYPHRVYCSKCYHTILPNVEWVELYGLNINWCPNCGVPLVRIVEEETNESK